MTYTANIHYMMTEFEHMTFASQHIKALCDYGLNFLITFCRGMQQFCFKSQLSLSFNPVTVLCSLSFLRSNVILCCCIVWDSTVKIKTRMDTDIRSACRSKQITLLKITLTTQFLHRM